MTTLKELLEAKILEAIRCKRDNEHYRNRNRYLTARLKNIDSANRALQQEITETK